MGQFFLTYWIVVVALDWASTIVAHDWRVETNPFMRNVWKVHGDIGFTLATLAFGIAGSLVIHYGYKYAYKWPITIALIPVLTFKGLIALTNLLVIPFWVMSWFNF
jgi:hypothetical protein